MKITLALMDEAYRLAYYTIHNTWSFRFLEIEDLVQQTFLRLLAYHPPDIEERWLPLIIKQTAITMLVKRLRTKRRGDERSFDDNLTAGKASHHAIQPRQLDQIYACEAVEQLKRLSKGQRNALIAVINGETDKSSKAAISLQTSQANQARARLRVWEASGRWPATRQSKGCR